jgi:hypothetical protein
MLGAETTGVDAKVLLRMSHVPTGICHLLDAQQSPLVTFRVKYLGDEFVRLRLISYIEGYSAHAVDTIELRAGHADGVDTEGYLTISQLPTFFPDRLSNVTELTRATLHIQIDDLDGKTEQQSTFPVWLLARSSAYNGVDDPATGQWKDLSAYYAAWVTPNATDVMRILRCAAGLHPERAMRDYQVGEDDVREQVKAIFNALKSEEIIYVNSVLSFGATKGQYMQRVRLPRESLTAKSANCIDGTLLVASLLEAASLNPGLVFVPGHAFAAWETADGNDNWDYLETTMIGSATFEQAIASGRAQASTQQALFEQTHDPYYFQRLSVPALRTKAGITPME